MARTTGDVLRRAAELVASGQEQYSCWAICRAARIQYDYQKLIPHPAGMAYAGFCGGFLPTVGMMFDEPRDRDDAQRFRALALCMAATIADEQSGVLRP